MRKSVILTQQEYLQSAIDHPRVGVEYYLKRAGFDMTVGYTIKRTEDGRLEFLEGQYD